MLAVRSLLLFQGVVRATISTKLRTIILSQLLAILLDDYDFVVVSEIEG